MIRRLQLLAPAVLLAGLAACVPQAEVIEGTLPARIEVGRRGGTASFDHSEWNRLLGAYAVDGGRRFDYAGLKQEEAALDGYLERLGGADLSMLSGPEIMALLINSYNAYTVKTILNEVGEDGEFAIASIRDIPRVFEVEAHPVAGEILSLDAIEHGLLRPIFRDPRVHFAVNCASISCPPLPPTAFRGDILEEQLDASTRSALTDSDYARLEGGAVWVSTIFDWFGSDFTDPEYEGAAPSVAEFVAGYNEEIRDHLLRLDDEPSVRFLDYDWGLNRP